MRPRDARMRVLPLYIEEDNPYRSRVRLDVTRLPRYSYALQAVARPLSLRPHTLACRIHRYTHAPAEEAKRILKLAGYRDRTLSRAVDRVSANCPLCAASGHPHPSKKASLSHVDQRFNEQLQADFTWIEMRGTKYVVLHAVDAGTGFSETEISTSRNAREMASSLERIWINNHGAPSSFSTDSEFDTRAMAAFLASHRIEYKPRPVRRHNKTGIVERKHRTLKVIVKRLQAERTTASDATILSRATFLSNIFAGSKILSSFELARGYTPSLLGMPSSIVGKDIFEAAREQAATRAIQRLLKSRVPSTIPPTTLQPGTPVLYFYRSSKACEPIEWRPGEVIQAGVHRVQIKNQSGRESFVAYEDLRLRPHSELTRQLMEGTLEETMETVQNDSPLEIPIDGAGSLTIQETEEGPTGSGSGSDDGSHDEYIESDRQDDVIDEIAPALSAGLFDGHAIEMHDESPPPAPRSDAAVRDTGDHTESIRLAAEPTGRELQSDKQIILRSIKDRIGTKQVTASQLSFVPSWVLDEAINDELGQNWEDAYEIVDVGNLPPDANVIASHVIFKLKDNPDGSLRLKARLVLHGNRDKDRFKVRRDSASAELLVVRLVLAIASILNFTVATADVKGAYMQSGSIKRDIFVRTFGPIETPRGKIWKLLRLPYGIVEAGRQWLCAVETWIKEEYGLSQVFGILQLFCERDQDGRIILLVAKVVDDFIVAGNRQAVEKFLKALGEKFELGAVNRSKTHSFLGCSIQRGYDGSIKLSMPGYIDRAHPIHIDRSRRPDTRAKATPRELSEYRSLAGVLVFLGQAVLPQAAFVASKMQQKLGDLRVGNILDANRMLEDLKAFTHAITYKAPVEPVEIRITTFSDASHGSLDDTYGQTGTITGLRIIQGGGHPDLFHCIDWTSHKQKQISYSSFGCEIIAAATGDDRGFNLKSSFGELFPHRLLKHELMVDSKSLYETITTLHQAREYRLRKTVARMRDSFESKDLNIVRWIPGRVNYADAMTKRSPAISERLNGMLVFGRWDLDFTGSSSLDSDEWR